MTYTFTIPHKLDGLNKLIYLNRSNKYLAAKHKKYVQGDIIYCIGNIPPIEKPVEIHFLWVEPDKRRDLDNIYSAKKYILDALVTAGVLKNDTQRYVVRLEDYILIDKNNKSGQVDVTIIEVD